MADIVDRPTRSRMMSGFGTKDTKPELIIRKALHHRGFRYRLNCRDIPGKPDIVLQKYKAIIFVHGCFWHQHNCHLFKWPSSNTEFWNKKLTHNRLHDERIHSRLIEDGWRIATIWECSLRSAQRLPIDWIVRRLSDWLEKETTTTLEIKGMPHGGIQ